MPTPEKRKKNVYLCKSCGHGYVSQDLDLGVTPFMARCLNCSEFAQSCFYNIPQKFLTDYRPAVEWYAPDMKELKTLTQSTRTHCEQGGLISRLTDTRKSL